MKKTILTLCLASVLFACKKETNSDSNGSPASQVKVPVKFSLENFLVSQQDMSANGRVEGTPSLSHIVKIIYIAFGSDSTKTVSTITQSASDPNFGTISDSLPVGTYTLVFGACSASNFQATTSGGIKWGNFYNSDLWLDPYDVFYKKIQITVSENGNLPAVDLTLNRIVGLLKVDLKDVLPYDNPNSGVTISLTNFPTMFTFKNDLASNIYNGSGTAYMKTATSHTWEHYVYGSTTPIQVVVNWKDKVTGAPLSKTISNVVVSPNKQTTISGFLYGVPENPGGSDYNLKTDQDWSTDSTTINFN